MARLWLRVQLDGAGALGPGKIELLEAIDRTGSISAAGRDLGMSYRRAWLLVDELNRLFREKVVIATMGGTRGGGTALSDFGRELITQFRAIEDEANQAVRRRLAVIEEAQADASVITDVAS